MAKEVREAACDPIWFPSIANEIETQTEDPNKEVAEKFIAKTPEKYKDGPKDWGKSTLF